MASKPVATQTAVAAIATQTAIVIQATQTAMVVQATQTVAAIATQTAVAVATQTAAAQATQAVVAATQTAVAQATQTMAVQQTQTAVVPATQTAVAQATQTQVAAQATQTYVAGLPTPVPATAQTIWKNGVLSAALWGQAVSTNQNSAQISNASVTDAITSDSTVLSVACNPAALVSFSTAFYISTSVNAGNYYAAGHIQFDLMGGGAYSSSGSTTTVCFNNGSCSWTISGISKTQFIHYSLPFTSVASCYSGTSAGNIVAFTSITFQGVETSFGSLGAGVQFYIDNLQITPN